MFTFPMIFPVLAALIGIFAIYRGGGGSTRVHALAAIAGGIVILCIAVFPFFALAAIGSFGGTESPYEPVFLAYAIVLGLSVLTALACGLRLTWQAYSRRAVT